MHYYSPVQGAVIIDDPSSWEGRPVKLGEKILSVADQNDVEIEAWLPMADAIKLPPGSPIRVYLNSRPLSPVEASLYFFSYEAQIRFNDSFSHRIRGKIIGNYCITIGNT